jgi:peptidoglycan/xylan/chitin deacetylase (PgdA/CDA1 family)
MRRSLRPGDAGTRQVLDTVLRRSPAQPAFRWRASRRLAVLAYHGIDDAAGFERHLDHLRRAASPVSLEDVLDAVARRRGLPRRAVLITFDDGDRSVLDVAMPMLADRGMPAVAFVVAGLLDTTSPVWTREAAELVAAGGGRAPRTVALVRELKGLPDDERVARMDALRRASGRAVPSVRQLERGDLRVLASAGVAIGNHSLTQP